MIDGNSSTALVRMQLFGSFQVERRNKDGIWETLDKAHWDRGYARSLFKRLLCSGGRRAERLTLIDDLWPNLDNPEQVERYLNDAAYQLRKVLRPASILKSYGHASGYELADQSLLWADADACEALMKDAEQIGRISASALQLLEQAKGYFARGDFLESESGLWVYARRGTLERLHYRCHIWLGEAYEQQGMIGQAEMLYSGLLEDTPSDEDVLCRLMSLLHRQGMTYRALRCYEETKKHIKHLGLSLSPTTSTFAKRLLSEPRQIELYGGWGTQKRLPLEDEQQFLLPAQSTIDNTPLKAQVLRQLPARIASLDADKETLDYFEKLTETCQFLSEGSELKIAERILWTYLPRMEAMTKLSFQNQQKTASIASQCYLLAASLAGHRDNLLERLQFSENALLYGKLANDLNLQVVALRQLAISYDYLERPDKALQIYQQTFSQLHEVSPLLRSCLYADVSGIYTQLNQKQEAFRFLGKAYEHFPENTGGEPSFLRTICRYSTLILCEGLYYLNFGQPQEAEKVFARINGLQPKISLPERIRIDLLNCQVEVFIALNAMEQAYQYLETAGKVAIAIGSERRFQESVAVFQQMAKIWRNEPLIQQLGDIFLQPMSNHIQ